MPFQAFSLKNDSGVLKGGSTLRQKEPGNLNLHIGDSCLFTKTTCFAHYVYKNKLSLHRVIEMLVLICCNIWQYPKIGTGHCALWKLALTYLKVFFKDTYQLYIV